MAHAFRPWEGGKTKCGLGDQSTCLFEKAYRATINVYQEWSTNHMLGYFDIRPAESSRGSKGTSPAALGQDTCLRKSPTRHPRTFVKNDSYSTADTI